MKELKDMTIEELFTLKGIVLDQSNDIANSLSTYATMYGDPSFEKMGKDTQELYKRRGKLVNLKNRIDAYINKHLEELL